MIAALLKAGSIAADEVDSIVKAIMKREELGTTGIGRGVAVPHTKHPSVQRLVGTVAVSNEGIDFNSLDGEKRATLLPAHLAARPAGRSFAGIGKHFDANCATIPFASFSSRPRSSDDIRLLLDEADNNGFAS